jgi:hypothetical protein
MATTSQKMMEIKFFVRIRGALTPPPRMDTPVVQIPLRVYKKLPPLLLGLIDIPCGAYNRQANAQSDAQTGPCVRRYGFEECSDLEARQHEHTAEQEWRARTLKASPSPWKSMSVRH